MNSIFLIILFSSFILLPSYGDAASTWSSNMIDEVCNKNAIDWNKTICIQTLKFDSRIISATNLHSLATGIIESGLSNANNTQIFMKTMLQKVEARSLYKMALNECIEFYNGAINSFSSALSEVKDEKEYMTASYDVLIAADNVKNCDKSLLSYKIYDAPIIYKGNQLAMYFGIAANEVVTRLTTNYLLNHKV